MVGRVVDGGAASGVVMLALEVWALETCEGSWSRVDRTVDMVCIVEIMKKIINRR